MMAGNAIGTLITITGTVIGKITIPQNITGMVSFSITIPVMLLRHFLPLPVW
jgi:hypothetical protein